MVFFELNKHYLDFFSTKKEFMIKLKSCYNWTKIL